MSSECEGQGPDRTWGNFAASAAFTSAMVATSAGCSSLRETGRPRRSVDLPVAVMVSELIARNSARRLERVGVTVGQFRPIIYAYLRQSLNGIKLCSCNKEQS